MCPSTIKNIKKKKLGLSHGVIECGSWQEIVAQCLPALWRSWGFWNDSHLLNLLIKWMVKLGSEPSPLVTCPVYPSQFVFIILLYVNVPGISHVDNRIHTQADVPQWKINMFLVYKPYWITHDLVMLWLPWWLYISFSCLLDTCF